MVMTSSAATPLLDFRRPSGYPRVILVAFLVYNFVYFGLGIIAVVYGRGLDFVNFWAASHLTLEGFPASAFDIHAIFEAERLGAPAADHVIPWAYPPTFQLIVTPLALMPYGVAWFVFVAASLIAYVLALRPLVKLREADPCDALVLAVGFPGLAVAILVGQNSLISAALFAGAAVAIDKRPRLAGALLGLLAFKPQLAFLVPVALLAARQWRAFFAAGVTALLFCSIATLVFGIDLWFAFFKNTLLMDNVLENGSVALWNKCPSAYIFVRVLGLPRALAYGVQAVTALAATASVAFVWYRKGATPLAFAVLVAAGLLVPHYCFYYEFALLAVPLAILASDMDRRGATRNEKIALVFLYAMPVVAVSFAGVLHFQPGFPALVLALVLSVRRALA